MLKLSQKKRNTCLAFAVAASILGGGSVLQQKLLITQPLLMV